MKKPPILLLLPGTLIPYATLLSLGLVLSSEKSSLSTWIIVHLFQSNGLRLFAALFLFTLAGVGFSAVFCLRARKEEWDLPAMAKAVMIIKLLQIPAYVAIFVLGILLIIAIWTIPFVIVLLILSGISLLATGLMQAGAVIRGSRQGLLSKKKPFAGC